MKLFDLYSPDSCPICGQPPCSCTHIAEEKVRLDPKSRVRVNNRVPAEGVAEGKRMKTASGMYRDQHTGVAYRGKTGQDGNDSYMTPDYLIQKYQERLAQIASGPYKRPKEVAQLKSRIAKLQGQQGVAEGADRAEAQADYMEGQCMVLAVAINQHNPKRYPIGYIWEYNMSAGAPDMQMDDDEWNDLSPEEQEEISNDISRHSVVHAYVRDQETNEYIDARGRHKTLPNLWGRMGQTRFEEFPGSARELIDITAHGDWDEVGDQVNFKRGQPAFDSLSGPAGVKKALDYAVKYLGVVSPESAKSPNVPQNQQGVAEGSEDSAEKYKAHLLKTAPRIMDFLAKTVKGWRPSEQEMLGAIDTAYTIMKHTGDVKQAGKAMMDELNTLHRMSQGQQGVAEGGYSGIDDTDTVGFSVNSERAYNAVMARFGDQIDHDETSGILYVPARLWPKVEMVAFDADGEGATQTDGLDEGEKVGNMDADAFDAAMARLKKLAGAGPMKTVYDPNKRVYRNVPTAVQPGTKK